MQITMARVGRKRKFRGYVPGRQNVRRISDDELMARQPHRNWLPEDKRLNEKAATPLGGLCLIGIISELQYQAGQRYVITVAEYRVVIGVPMEGFTGSRGFACKGERNCEPCECRRRKQRYDAAYGAVFDAGQRAARAVAQVAVHGHACPRGDIEHLKSGLDALIRHYGLDNENRKMPKRIMS
jgi:hypothetical protein